MTLALLLTIPRFQTYFPHVDNIYSHRSTQRYKRKPFVSHYWDCRLKGRPPGTPKSEDPNKKKRKRTARQRDLCDVKIKITEYFPSAMEPQAFSPNGTSSMDPNNTNNFFAPGQPGGPPLQHSPPFSMIAPNGGFSVGNSSATTQRYYTIQRVNGNGGNGKGDGVAGPHKHTLEDSDRVKKNSVQRYMLKEEKEKKKTQVSSVSCDYPCHRSIIIVCNLLQAVCAVSMLWLRVGREQTWHGARLTWSVKLLICNARAASLSPGPM